MNIGHSSRLPYDGCAYKDRLSESVGPLGYRLSPDQMYNCNSCLSTLGPRASNLGRGYDVSRIYETGYAASQDLVDVESVLSNRNVKQSKCKTGKCNPVNVTKYKNNDVRLCNNYLDPESTHLSYPASNYRDISINRFYNLVRDPQANIFWDFSVNTKNEAKDNLMPDLPTPWVDLSGPKENVKDYVRCETGCSGVGKTCPTSWGTNFK